MTITRKGSKKTITGKPKLLKKSGEYPLQYGLALAGLFTSGPRPNPLFDRGSKVFRVRNRHFVLHFVRSFPVVISGPAKELSVDGDLDMDDNGCIDDLLKGPSHCNWRQLV